MQLADNPVIKPDNRTWNVPGMHIWGYMDPFEMQWLFATAKIMQSAIQIGCLYGKSAFALLTACQGPVHCIDHALFGPYPFMSNCGHFPNLRAINGVSWDVADQLPEVDMVFIDGDHTYEGLTRDLKLYTPKAKKLVCGHDYNLDSCPEVREAVDKYFGGKVASFMSPFKDFGPTCGDRGNIWMKWIG